MAHDVDHNDDDHDDDDFRVFCETDENVGALTSHLVTPGDYVLQLEVAHQRGSERDFTGAEQPYRLEMLCDTVAPSVSPSTTPTQPPTRTSTSRPTVSVQINLGASEGDADASSSTVGGIVMAIILCIVIAGLLALFHRRPNGEAHHDKRALDDPNATALTNPEFDKGAVSPAIKDGPRPSIQGLLQAHIAMDDASESAYEQAYDATNNGGAMSLSNPLYSGAGPRATQNGAVPAAASTAYFDPSAVVPLYGASPLTAQNGAARGGADAAVASTTYLDPSPAPAPVPNLYATAHGTADDLYAMVDDNAAMPVYMYDTADLVAPAPCATAHGTPDDLYATAVSQHGNTSLRK